MDGTVTIYALCEPDGRPRYVGQTGRTLEQRLYEHLHEPYAAASRGFPRCVWIASLCSDSGGWSLHTEMIRGLRGHVKRERRGVPLRRPRPRREAS